MRAALVSSAFFVLVATPALAQDPKCDAKSQAGDVCVCAISALHPTQALIGLAQVKEKAAELKIKMQTSGGDLMPYLRKCKRQEPVIIGPGGILYITDHHHLARALDEIEVKDTYCRIKANLSAAQPDDFWRRLEAGGEVYLEDQDGNRITPEELPSSIRDLRNYPFRSVAGLMDESCALEKASDSSCEAANGAPAASNSDDFLEFKWAAFFRTHWAKTGFPVDEIDQRLNDAAKAALGLLDDADAQALPNRTGKTSCAEK